MDGVGLGEHETWAPETTGWGPRMPGHRFLQQGWQSLYHPPPLPVTHPRGLGITGQNLLPLTKFPGGPLLAIPQGESALSL